MAVTQSTKRVVKMTAAADALSGRSILRGLVWVGPTTAGHILTVSDSDTGEIFSSVCSAANQGDQLLLPTMGMPVYNLTVTTMTSGYLLVYLD